MTVLSVRYPCASDSDLLANVFASAVFRSRALRVENYFRVRADFRKRKLRDAKDQYKHARQQLEQHVLYCDLSRWSDPF
jgi:hypothetical protein